MIFSSPYNGAINNTNGAMIMNNQVKLFAANIILAAVTFIAVGVAHADAVSPVQGQSAKSPVAQYLAAVGEQAAASYQAAR